MHSHVDQKVVQNQNSNFNLLHILYSFDPMDTTQCTITQAIWKKKIQTSTEIFNNYSAKAKWI